jgi:hypothetical protein
VEFPDTRDFGKFDAPNPTGRVNLLKTRLSGNWFGSHLPLRHHGVWGDFTGISGLPDWRDSPGTDIQDVFLPTISRDVPLIPTAPEVVPEPANAEDAAPDHFESLRRNHAKLQDYSRCSKKSQSMAESFQHGTQP